ncbi:MAG: hypothetical protein HY294_01035 [Candidatus Rokubacteria bacterium]|nr:hypothetical protein [Candidatus Rokubacteria bacterium]MBI3824564.1 hypothetical protein [Candidatus Rokubacteria bacterium]
MGVRMVATMVALALILAAPLVPRASAQQPARPDMSPDRARPMASDRRGPDVYDAGAVALTALGAPLKAGMCGVSMVVGVALFVTTMGSAHQSATGVVEEGCNVKWLLTGDDLRPDRAAASREFDWERE